LWNARPEWAFAVYEVFDFVCCEELVCSGRLIGIRKTEAKRETLRVLTVLPREKCEMALGRISVKFT
jgi:hypothetical protein